MKIASLVKTSFVDYPPNIASVVFTKGCNMVCPYCQNIDIEDIDTLIAEEEVLAFLDERKSLINAVVISGGEPTLQKDLVNFIRKCKGMGYLVKLDTNGTNPHMLKCLIQEKLIDYVAMDIKASQDKYQEISGIEYSDIEESINLLLNFGQYEFRTTLYPGLNIEEIRQLCRQYKETNYVIQQYRPTKKSKLQPYDNQVIDDLGKEFDIKVRR